MDTRVQIENVCYYITRRQLNLDIENVIRMSTCMCKVNR